MEGGRLREGGKRFGEEEEDRLRECCYHGHLPSLSSSVSVYQHFGSDPLLKCADVIL